MNVLKEMNSLTIKDKDDLEDIYDTLEMKLDSLECSEPESCGETHDRWEERCDDLQEILDDFESLIEELNDLEERIDDEDLDDEEEIEDKYEDEYDALSDDLDDLVDRLEDHQLEYGGYPQFKSV